MAIGPPTGMRDWLPQETLLRQRLMETISSVYQLYGYLPIDTPAIEDLEVLLGKGGGENEKLLFKILKRGDKLAQAKEEGKDLADYGLRFDLTVPLARFVATHQGKLPKIFRRYHIGPVWRADRPQREGASQAGSHLLGWHPRATGVEISEIARSRNGRTARNIPARG